MLYIVPTPIGNLADMTYRAVLTLTSVSVILAEDTRVSAKLLKHYEIGTPLQSFHAHNEHQSVTKWVERLGAGEDIALISDAGTPGISDPGFLLIRACVAAGVRVECLPGATAFVPAIVSSGLPCDKFHFEGFLPQKKGRQSRLKWVMSYPYSVVLYESPHRLVKLLKEISAYLAQPETEDRLICVARELSKLHEDIKTDRVEVLLDYYENQPKVRGEIVVVIGKV